MRLRLLMRRLTVSAPRMAVRSAMPWPLRWVALAVVAGFCAAIALWAFEFGKEIAGLDHGSKVQLQQALIDNTALRTQLEALTEQRNKAQAVANTADTLLTTEKVAQEKLVALNKELSLENQRLKDDLGFFEQLVPTTGTNVGRLAIRGLQAQALASGEVKWQVLVIQAVKNPVEFEGQLEIVFYGVLNGKPWTGSLSGGAVSVKVKQYGRVEGIYQPPPQAVLRSATAKLLEGSVVKAVYAIKLP